MKLRLYHHRDGARIAYREAGVGPSLCLVHSAALSHREFVPLVEHLTDRFRLVLPDLPLHGDSEDRPRHPYTIDWLAEVMADFCRQTCGSHPLVGGHGAGAEIVLRAVAVVVQPQLHPAASPRRMPRASSRCDASAVTPKDATCSRRRASCAATPGVCAAPRRTAPTR